MRRRIAALFLAGATAIGSADAARQSVQLTSSPALSPDGAKLAFAWRGDVWTVSSRGGRARRLTVHPARDSDPKFSPDGKTIAFVSDRAGSRQVYLVGVSGGEPRPLTFHTEGCSLEDWYPDGSAVLIRAERDHYWRHAERFFRIDATRRAAEELLFDDYGHDGAISPDGERLLFVREGERWWRKGYRGSRAGQIWLFERKSGKFSKVIGRESESRSPLWAPDGKGFYYVGAQRGAFNLWYRELREGRERQLTRFDDDSVVMPCIARDGSTIVFRHLFDLYRIEPGKDEAPEKLDVFCRADQAVEPLERRTLDAATGVAFSADGLEIAFVAGGDLWVMDTELREPRQVTRTPEEERDPVFSPDGKSILFVSGAEGQSDVWKAIRADDGKYWWQNDRFTRTRLTHDVEGEAGLQWSPAGDLVAFVRGRGDLWVMKPDGTEARCVVPSWSRPDFDWSPDGKWFVYARPDGDDNRDVWLAPLDGSREPFNLSRHPYDDASPVWSPDGKMIAFTGRRAGAEVDVHFVLLTKEEDEIDSRDRKVKSAVEKIEKVRKKPSPDDKPSDPNAGKTPGKADAGQPPEVAIDFDGIHERIRRVAIPNSVESGLVWSHDSTKLAFRAEVGGKRGTYTIAPPADLAPKLLSTATGEQGRWIARGNQIVWLSDRVPASLSSDGKATAYRFAALQEIDVAARYEAAFDVCWRTMRDRFYDGNLNNRNWDAIRRKYAPAARAVVDHEAFGDVVSLMLGELNASHLGFSPSRESDSSGGAWRERTAHLGLRFEPGYRGPGLKVKDVIAGGPADQVKSKIVAGEIVLQIDDTPVDPALDLTAVLNGRPHRDVRLRIREAAGQERDAVLRPIDFGVARSLLYDQWIRRNREAVDKASGGKLGYLHVRAMDMPSFFRFERDLYAATIGKDGLIIDVRENGGGSTTDHLLTALTQPIHAITLSRDGEPGYPQDRTVYATWNKPIAVLCNQNSFSNAEIFSHAIKTLGRGPLVGVTTAGGVITTGSIQVIDVGRLRLPYRGWFLVRDGHDMELNGAVPDHVVWPKPTEMPRGKDRQLEKAIAVLKADVRKWQKRPMPKLERASER